MKKIYIGTSGWSYKHWRGSFYPTDIKIKDHFAYYISQFNTVEINNSFYRLPKRETFISWKENTPDDFLFVIKASRFITHMKKLNDPEQSLQRFLENVSLLDDKLGPILFQLPPFLLKNAILLENFLKALPDHYRYAFEFRHPSWYDESILRLLKKYNSAFCIYHLEYHQSPIQVTADFVYIRLHGPGLKYQGSYQDKELEMWAERCINWLKTKDVFVYFDNDDSGYAAFNASKLIELTTN